MFRFDYDPKNESKNDWFTFTLPDKTTQQGKYINDAFQWWILYLPSFKDGWVEVETGQAPKMKFNFGSAVFQIPNRQLSILRFIQNLKKLPLEHFKDKTWYDTLTGMARFGYIPLIREAA